MTNRYAFQAIPVLLCAAASVLCAAAVQADELDCLAARPIHEVIEGDHAARPGLAASVYTSSALKPVSDAPLSGGGTPAGGGVSSGTALY